MKVIKTLQASDTSGNPAPFTAPVTMTWYEGDSLIEAAHAVTQILAAAYGERFVKTLSIHVEL